MRSEKRRIRYSKAIASNSLLKGFPKDELSVLIEELEEVVWPKNTCSISDERTSNHFHFIISGRLKVYQIDRETGREFTFFLLKKNDVFDTLCLLDGCEHAVYYETLDRVVLLSLPMRIMKQWVQDHPGINKNLLHYLAHQMRTLEEYASNVTLTDIPTRLARLILSYINLESKELELINDLSDEELANLIGSTRAVVNRHLQQFKNDGIIDLGRKKVGIKNLGLLLDKANRNGASAP
jgi:CRP/FNR family transcriptional regulator